MAEVFELFATLGMDTAEFERQLMSASAQGQALADTLAAQTAQVQGQLNAAMNEAASSAEGLQSRMSAVCASLAADWQSVAAAIRSAASAAGSFRSPGAMAKGYATGLDYVPYDGFPAVLHEGEAVLTRREAEQARGGIDAAALAEAVASALNGVTLTMDGEAVGRMVAPSVSEALADSVKSRRYTG